MFVSLSKYSAFKSYGFFSMYSIIKNIFKQPNLWAAALPLQLLGIYSVFQLFSNEFSVTTLIYIICGTICIELLGVSIGLHRWASHQSFEVHPLWKPIILFFSCLACQGSAIFWATIHRSYHHRYSDTDKDPHSFKDGFLHSYILWMFKIEEGKYNGKRILDLLNDKTVVFFHKYYILIIWLTNLIAFFVDQNFWLFFIIFPSFITFHKFCLQTSIVHNIKLGYRNYHTKEDSVNIPWLFPITFGEAWHNNHHSNPKSPKIIKVNWWEIDPTYFLVKLICK